MLKEPGSQVRISHESCLVPARRFRVAEDAPRRVLHVFHHLDFVLSTSFLHIMELHMTNDSNALKTYITKQ